jgi:hypothetical protein
VGVCWICVSDEQARALAVIARVTSFGLYTVRYVFGSHLFAE